MLKEIQFSLPVCILSDIKDINKKCKHEAMVDIQSCFCINKTWKCFFEDANSSCNLTIAKWTGSDEIVFSFKDLNGISSLEMDCLSLRARTVEVCENGKEGKGMCRLCGLMTSNPKSPYNVKDNTPPTSKKQKQQKACNEVDIKHSTKSPEKTRKCHDVLTIHQQDKCDRSLGSNCERKRYSLRGVKIPEKIINAERLVLNETSNTQPKKRSYPKQLKNDSDTNGKKVLRKHDSEEMHLTKDTCSDDCSEDTPQELNSAGSIFGMVCDNTKDKNDKDDTVDDLPIDVSEKNDKDDDRDYIPNEHEKRKCRKSGSEFPVIEKESKEIVQEKNIKSVQRIKTVRDKKCKYCSNKFISYSGVENHVKMYHKDKEDIEEYIVQLKSFKELSCAKCGKEYKEESALEQHFENIHRTAERDTSCFKCNSKLKNIQSLRNHLRNVHGNLSQNELCHLCPAKFKSKSSLRHHISEIHEKKLDVQCEICGQKFARKNLLNRHMVSHGVDKSKWLVCTECGKGFWFKYNLKRHMKVVHGPHEEKHHCSYCGKGFSLKSGMVSHVQQVHFSIFPFQCPVEECKAGFGRKRAVDEHMRQAHPGVEYVPLKSKTARKRYKYWKSTEDLFYCSHCSSSFCYKAKLVEHMHIAHSDAFPYKCDICSQGFLEHSFLLYHQKKAHNIDVGSMDTGIEVSKSRRQVPHRIKDTGKDTFGGKLRALLEGNDSAENAGSKTTSIFKTKEIEKECFSSESVPNVVDESQSVLQKNTVVPLEDSSEGSTIHYIIEEGGDGTVLTKELVDLVLNSSETLALASENGMKTITLLTTPDSEEPLIVQTLERSDSSSV